MIGADPGVRLQTDPERHTVSDMLKERGGEAAASSPKVGSPGHLTSIRARQGRLKMNKAANGRIVKLVEHCGVLKCLHFPIIRLDVAGPSSRTLRGRRKVGQHLDGEP
jgi:hypothetical protein